jgi:hypothetical protein
MELLGGESQTHALKLIASLAAAMGCEFAGPVREQALHAWRALVQCLAVHSPAMLRQVAPHIISHLLLVLSEGPEGEGSGAAGRAAEVVVIEEGREESAVRTARGVQSAERAAELEAMEEVLHKLVVENGQELGADVLASIPALSPEMPVRRLAEIQQVCALA